MESVRTEPGAVWRVTLARPAARNALNADMVRGLESALADAAADPAARVVVLAGEGADFCAGADLEELLASADAPPEANEASAHRLGSLFTRMRCLPRPVIAVVR
ncbi:MAG: enoyl-CoA hydratase/isomerase family protein, partial [Actinomycetota bacterium]|nr:enoyl-CoA hydratase/isomerase family protein [Actinomycetota bacterium]